MPGLDKYAPKNYNCFDKAILEYAMVFFDNYLNVIEAGRRLRIHPETVKRLCRQGDLPAAKIHNTWLIERNVLDNFAGTYNPGRGARKRLIT